MTVLILDAERKLGTVRRFKKLWTAHDPQYALGTSAWERQGRELQKLFPKFSADVDYLYPQIQSIPISLVITSDIPGRYDDHVREQYRAGTQLLLRYEGMLEEALRGKARILQEIESVVRRVVEAGVLDEESSHRYRLEAELAEGELSKKSPDLGVVRTALAFLADIDGTLGLATKVAQWSVLSQGIARIVGKLA